MKRFKIYLNAVWVDPETGDPRGDVRGYQAIHDRTLDRYALFARSNMRVHALADEMNANHQEALMYAWQESEEVR